MIADNQATDGAADDWGHVRVTTNQGGLLLYESDSWRNYPDEIADLAHGCVYDVPDGMAGRPWFLGGNIVLYDFMSWSTLDERNGGEIETDDQRRIWLIARENNRKE